MGHIGRHLRHCYEALLGENMKTNMIGVKKTTKDIEKLHKEFEFPIYVDENERAINELNPDIIILSPKPYQVHDIVSNTLKPYFETIRQQGRQLPMLFAFAPDPPVTFYTDVLGNDLNAVNVIPNMVYSIQDLCVASIGYNMLTFDRRVKWTPERKKFAFDFMMPLGPSVDCALDTTHAILAGKISAHSIYEISMTISDALQSRLISENSNAIAEAGRAYLRARFDTFAPDIYHCSISKINEIFRPFVEKIYKNWYDGIIDLCMDKGVDSYVSSRFIRGIFEMHLLTVQIENREQLINNISQHATKGGVLENSIRTFKENYARPLENAVLQYLDGRLDECFWQQWRKMAYDLTSMTTEFGAQVSKTRDTTSR